MRPIERWQRDEIERCKNHVQLNAEDEHQLEDRCRPGENRRQVADQVHEHDHRHAKDSDDKVRRDAGKRHDDVALLEVAVITRIDRDGLGAAKDRSVGKEQQQRQDDRHERIDVLCRIPRQPAELKGGRVAVFEGRIAVGILVRDHRKKQDGRDENETLEVTQLFRGAIAHKLTGARRRMADAGLSLPVTE